MRINDLMNGKKFKKMMKAGKKAYGRVDMDSILEGAGLERRSVAADIAADLGFFAVGCICGALVGVFFAPKPGVELRHTFKKAINEKGIMTGVAESVKSEVGSRA